jgi:serine/threonine protein kinase/DNA-directed RNA polymerase subunit RPC12/RpoP
VVGMKVYCPKCKNEFDDFCEEHSTICTKCGQKLLLTVQTNGEHSTESNQVKADAPTKSQNGSTVDTGRTSGIPIELAGYRLIRLIGNGGFAHVFLAADESNKKYAIKIPRTDRPQSAVQVERFLQEARNHAALKHPGIVSVSEVSRDEDSGQDFIVMDYVEGSTLNQLLKDQGPMPAEDAAAMMTKIASAVHYAHTNQIFHRDIKPSNILLDKSGNPYVSDFGLAVHEDEQGELEGEVAGTLPFMAPEQIDGDVHRLDGRTDIWGLGVVFYCMLTGRLPFRSKTNDLATDIMERDPRPPRQIIDTVPRELNDICLKCLEKPVTKRYSAAIDLVDELEEWFTTKDKPSVRSTRKTTMTMAATIILLVSSIVAAVTNRFENAFNVDNYARPGIPNTIMESEAEVLLYPSELDVFQDRDGHILRVDAAQATMIALGETNSDNFTIQMTLKKQKWLGTTGVFWGHSPDSPYVHVVAISAFQHRGKYVWNIIRTLWKSRDGNFVIKHHVGVRTVTGVNHGSPAVLQISVKDGKMVSFNWKGDNKFRWDHGREMADPTRRENQAPSQGKFGAFTEVSSATFRDGVITLNKNN